MEVVFAKRTLLLGERGKEEGCFINNREEGDDDEVAVAWVRDRCRVPGN